MSDSIESLSINHEVSGESGALSLPPTSTSTFFKDFLPPKPLLKNSMTAAVTHVSSDGVIYVQDISNGELSYDCFSNCH